MIADESRPLPAVGNLKDGVLELGAFCREIVTFVERELPVWVERPEISGFEDEPRLNQSLCLHLDRASRHRFDSIRFLQEPIQGSGRNADLGVFPVEGITVQGIGYQDYEQLLPIECKRLPTPTDSRRSDIEYVHGLPDHRTGGIERFKHGLHGRENRHALIIAYLQAESSKHWLRVINERLTELALRGSDGGLWNPSELLTLGASVVPTRVNRLSSQHKRVQPPCCSDNVNMDHLWLQINFPSR